MSDEYKLHIVDYLHSVEGELKDIELYDSIEDAIKEASSTAWEEEDFKSMRGCMIIVNAESNVIEAAGTFIEPQDCSKEPLLIWMITKTGETITKKYETEYARFLPSFKTFKNNVAAQDGVSRINPESEQKNRAAKLLEERLSENNGNCDECVPF